jgi:hypothetical protein
MRLLSVVLLTGALLIASAGGVVGYEPSPFEGVWFAIDSDGSSLTLEIQASGSGKHKVTFDDDDASVCGPGIHPITIKGSGTVTDDVLNWESKGFKCPNGGAKFEGGPGTIHFSSPPDTLVWCPGGHTFSRVPPGTNVLSPCP